PSRHAASASGATAPRFGASRWRWPCKDSSNSSVERAVDRQNVRSVRYRTFVLSSSGCPLALSTQKPPLDSSYLEKLQDYYAEHKVIPSYSVLASLWGISAKSWVSECVRRFEEAGYLDWTPDRQLKPGARFFERRLADQPVQAGLPNPAVADGYDLITIDDYLVRLPS